MAVIIAVVIIVTVVITIVMAVIIAMVIVVTIVIMIVVFIVVLAVFFLLFLFLLFLLVAGIAITIPVIGEFDPIGALVLGTDFHAQVKRHNTDSHVFRRIAIGQQLINQIIRGRPQGFDFIAAAHGTGIIQHQGQFHLVRTVHRLAFGSDIEMINPGQ